MCEIKKYFRLKNGMLDVRCVVILRPNVSTLNFERCEPKENKCMTSSLLVYMYNALAYRFHDKKYQQPLLEAEFDSTDFCCKNWRSTSLSFFSKPLPISFRKFTLRFFVSRDAYTPCWIDGGGSLKTTGVRERYVVIIAFVWHSTQNGRSPTFNIVSACFLHNGYLNKGLVWYLNRQYLKTLQTERMWQFVVANHVRWKWF